MPPSPSKQPPLIQPRTSSLVPHRVSTKRRAEDEEADKENIPEFTARDVAATAELEEHINDSRKRLKAKGSMGAEFWTQAKHMTEQELRLHELRHKRSFHEFISTGGEKKS